MFESDTDLAYPPDLTRFLNYVGETVHAGIVYCLAVRSSLPSRREGRVLFGFHEGMLIALHAFIKKTQATPASELALARQRLKEVTS